MTITAWNFLTPFNLAWGEDVFAEDNLLASYPFKVRVVVMPDISPRNLIVSNFLTVGLESIDRIAEKLTIDRDNLVLYYPERWLTVNETREFMYNLTFFGYTKILTKVSIVTNSPILLTDFDINQIKILKFNE